MSLWTSIFGKRKPAPRAEQPRVVRARYDAAQTNADNRNHWAAADSLSPTGANTDAIRKRLRNRARYEIANNSYAKGMIVTMANEVIGTGPRLQFGSEYDDVNDAVERRWREWMDSTRLAEKLRTAFMAMVGDGEGIVKLFENEFADPQGVQLDAEPIETDRLDCEGDFSVAESSIEYDRSGRPTLYKILREHPGDLLVTDPRGRERVPAQYVLHMFRADRPGQLRGVPWITPALGLFAQLRRYTAATLAAAETAANLAAVLESPAPADTEDMADPWVEVPIEKNTFTTLPAGTKLSQLKAEQPVAMYGEFKNEIIKEIARSLGIPFNVAAGNSGGMNYSSGRLDYQNWYRTLRVMRSDLELMLDRIFGLWFAEAVLIPGYIPAIPKADFPIDHAWYWDGAEYIDPLKEAKADETRLLAGMLSRSEYYARRGLDWSKEMRQIAKEKKMMADLGLDYSPQPAAPMAPNDPLLDQEDPVPAGANENK